MDERTTHTPGAIRATRALWEAGWFPREISLKGACEIIDRETDCAGMLEALNLALAAVVNPQMCDAEVVADNLRCVILKARAGSQGEGK